MRVVVVYVYNSIFIVGIRLREIFFLSYFFVCLIVGYEKLDNFISFKNEFFIGLVKMFCE